jgi:two-component system chemotaxis response regulator CheB
VAKIRVLVVDDSVVIRRQLTVYLSNDPGIEVIGSASDGKIALEKIAQLRPDLVILDLAMPVMDGLQTLTAIREISPTLPVIIFSVMTEHGACATLDALALGASDYVSKGTDRCSAEEHICADLIPKIKALCPTETLAPKPVRVTPGVRSMARLLPASRLDIVAIGISTGGPNALAALMKDLPLDLPVPILIVQHMPKMFTRMLAERLDAISSYVVREGVSGERVRPGEIWIAPGGFHMEVEKVSDGVRLVTHEGPMENSCRPAVDVLFRSVAATYGPHALAIVMTGMGQDGLRGCEAIREKGGRVIIQDEGTSIVWGMPGAIQHAGLSQKTVPLQGLGAEIGSLARTGRCTVANTDSPTRLKALVSPGAPHE